MTEPFDAAADVAGVLSPRAAYNLGVEHGREMERGPMQTAPELRAHIRHLEDALDRTLPAAADADGDQCTYANALQAENADLWRQLAAAQAALTLEQAAHRVTREALAFYAGSGGFLARAALAATEGEGASAW